MNNSNICEEYQSGFWAKHSTDMALIRVNSDLLLAADFGASSVLTVLNLTSAFDAFDHDILIKHLENCS